MMYVYLPCMSHITQRGWQTPLHAESRGGKPDCVRLLLDRGADIEAKDNVSMSIAMEV